MITLQWRLNVISLESISGHFLTVGIFSGVVQYIIFSFITKDKFITTFFPVVMAFVLGFTHYRLDMSWELSYGVAVLSIVVSAVMLMWVEGKAQEEDDNCYYPDNSSPRSGVIIEGEYKVID